ncbi:MAG: MFS transporter [Sphingomonas sp.]|nr:MFS transporter [Sphingomonas sp.]
MVSDESTCVASERPALSESRRLRLFAVFILYVAQGVPIGLLWFAIPAWMAANGASAANVAYVLGLTALPWSLKFGNGFIMDRYTLLAMGRRRIWVIGAQMVVVIGLLVCAVLSPAADDIWLLAAMGFGVNAATAFQDVAVDGLAVDIMEEEERARAGGMMFGGQSIGMAVSTASTGAAIAAYGPSAAYLLAALFIGLITLFVIATRERPGERLLPWTSGEPTAANVAIQADRWWPVLKHTFVAIIRPVSMIWLAILLIRGIQNGVMTGATPLIAAGSAGWAEDRISAISGMGQLVGGIVGMTLGGIVGDRLGAKRASLLFFACWLALNAAMFLAQPLWSDSGFVTAFMLVWRPLDTLIAVALLPVSMRLCNATVAATQFTLYMALTNFGITLGALLLGLDERIGGIAPLFMVIGILDIAAIAVLLTVRFPERRIDELVTQELRSGGAAAPN